MIEMKIKCYKCGYLSENLIIYSHATFEHNILIEKYWKSFESHLSKCKISVLIDSQDGGENEYHFYEKILALNKINENLYNIVTDNQKNHGRFSTYLYTKENAKKLCEFLNYKTDLL